MSRCYSARGAPEGRRSEQARQPHREPQHDVRHLGHRRGRGRADWTWNRSQASTSGSAATSSSTGCSPARGAPRDDRWSALARAALREDLYGLHRMLTAEVLRVGPPDMDADERVTLWVAANPAAERCMQTLADIRVRGMFDLTTLPVAVREVRNLLQAPAPLPIAPGAIEDGRRP